MIDVSLVIINDDGEQYLSRLFKSIKDQVNINDLDIIFIDNCSTDNSIAKVKEYGIEKVYSFDDKIENVGVIYNKAYSYCQANNILYIHSDIYFLDDFFKELQNFLNVNKNFGFINFSQYYADLNYFGLEKIGFDFNMRKVCYRHIFKHFPETIDWLTHCSEACFMIKREALKTFKFNEELKQSFSEHLLLRNIGDSGGEIYTLENCKFVHYFIELHQKFKTIRYDNEVLMTNTSNIMFPLLADKINYLEKKIQRLENELAVKHALIASLGLKSRLKRLVKKMFFLD